MKAIFETESVDEAQLIVAALAAGTPASPPAKGARGKKGGDDAAATAAAPAAAPAAPATPIVVAPTPPDSQAAAAASGTTVEDVKRIVVDAAGKLTVPVVIEILKSVAGVQKAGQVPPDKFDAVIAAVNAKVAETEAQSIV